MRRRLFNGILGNRPITVSRSTAPVLTEGQWAMETVITVDDALLSDLPGEEQEIVRDWIRANIIPSRYVLEYYTSYTLKHILERDTGIFLSNNMMKSALLEAGYAPVDKRKKNWRYKISPRSPAFKIDEYNRINRL